MGAGNVKKVVGKRRFLASPTKFLFIGIIVIYVANVQRDAQQRLS